MDDAAKTGTGRLGRGPGSFRFSAAEARVFVRSDLTRRLAVLLAGVISGFMILQVMTGPGLPTATVELFRADATPLSPALGSHVMWAPAMGLVVAYALWVWLPWALRSRRVAVTAYPAMASILLIAGWFWAVEQGRFRTSLVLVALAWSALVVTLARSARARSVGFVDRQMTQLPFAVLLGWMTIMAAGNLALAAKVWGRRPWQIPVETWWVLGVVAVLAVAMVLLRYLPGRLFIGATIAWGLLAIAYARVVGQPRAYAVAMACLVSAALVLVAAVAVLMWLRTRKLY